MQKELTIIIPCYNTEIYIEKCLNSILNQAYKDFVIIAIDDNSTDKTYDILKKFENNNDNIVVLQNEKNEGAGYSRNKALSFCNSRYVTFIDSDDYIDENYYKNHMSVIKTNKADISVCDFKIIYENKDNFTEISECCNYANKEDFIINGLAASPCNKVFKKDLFKENTFAENIMNEDVPAIITAMIRANKIVYAKNTYYNYIQRNSSVQNATLSDKKLDIFKSVDILHNRIKTDKYEKYWDGIIFYQLILLLFYVVPKEKNNIVRLNFLKKYSKSIKKYNIKQNTYLQKFFDEQGAKHKVYYKLITLFTIYNQIYLVNILFYLYGLYQKYLRKNVIKCEISIDTLINLAKKQKTYKQKDISVIIPNYNYEKFLMQRIYSILNQNIAIKELIILDDCSSDNSIEKINFIYDKLKKYIDIKTFFNKENSGSAFKQWEKGIKLSKGKYIWICEADDYCDKKFLKKIFKSMNDEVSLAYSNTAFIDVNGYIIQRNINNDIDLQKTGHWNKSYINDGLDEINNYSYLNCTIANVSSTIFKRNNFDKIFNNIRDFKQAGDWLFYIELMKLGKILFIKESLNYYRIHGNNVTSTNKKELHLNEIKKIHNTLTKELNLSKEKQEKIKDRQNYLKKVWKL